MHGLTPKACGKILNPALRFVLQPNVIRRARSNLTWDLLRKTVTSKSVTAPPNRSIADPPGFRFERTRCARVKTKQSIAILRQRADEWKLFYPRGAALPATRPTHKVAVTHNLGMVVFFSTGFPFSPSDLLVFAR
ncbi:hypothetical protein AVEN_20587-1 [Araneus ventricosus]|uniref:Uncharacterized protein n=1 Tax=Araneus ventricosus TaxID=182803 RepID=A0A4Y2EI81_ARAVE|nr:hypothetical protein AVEN_20587-1 [Araneus ventricosus]